tara:strand:- start:165 stop:557 length:393 start_codon:yes stop_codon:yes gene_type:complete
MALKRYVTEMGMGVDVHGRDYTNAARRAVSDAIRHSSLHFFQATNKSREDMRITLIIAVTEPGAVDSKAVAAELPYGSVTVEVRQGGLEVPNEVGDDAIVIANAAVLVCFEESKRPFQRQRKKSRDENLN